ncbi:hypothetical protein AB1Y20_016425 [Prymnesium parvum]|uniref:COMM domain-containing protein n=1 Tax=Prymnesium parvum TaxID=97485 RepID=A0AB34ICN9_PRYPA
MKFLFCGGLDVPDWLLSQIAVLSKISAVRVKLCAAAVAKQAYGEAVPFEKLSKLLGDAKLDAAETKAVVAALHFIVTSAARHDVDSVVLGEELQQLGLPREHTDALTASFVDARQPMQRRFREQSLRLPQLDSLHWRLCEDTGGDGAHAIELQLALRSQHASQPRPLSLRLTPQMLTLLRAELQGARERMAALPS